MSLSSLIRPLASFFGISTPEPVDPEKEAELRKAFRHRFHAFNLLLTANNQALDAMTEIEEKLQGHSPFGVNNIRSMCVRVSSNVHQIITHLNGLTDGHYPQLFERYSMINGKVKAIVSPGTRTPEGPAFLDLARISAEHVDLVGGKLANLGEAALHLDLPIPRGFAITASAYRSLVSTGGLQDEIDRLIQMTETTGLDDLYRLSSTIQQLIIAAPLPPDLEAALYDRFDELAAGTGGGHKVALRSSALGEDSYGASFAGQYSSELNIGRESLVAAYKQVIASKYNATAMTYRLRHGIPDQGVDMCVGCMLMVDARAGGVAYSRNPLDVRDDSIIINAVPGLPKGVVDGRVEPDTFLASKGDDRRLLQAVSGRQDSKYIKDKGEGIRLARTTEEENTGLCIDEATVLRVAEMAERLERYFGCPQDMEWALSGKGEVILLQCRPLRISEAGRHTEGRILASQDDGCGVLFSGGTTASPGAGAGPVRLVRKQADALSFPQGGVLVTLQALPQWASLLSRASAVISVQGSLAGHLANVARELHIPALFGVHQAFEILKQNQTVTVDADAGRILEGTVETLLRKPEADKGFMTGSPVHEMLRAAAEHIIPLHLLNPDSVDFTPANCDSFHDITRFCHERAVRDMFRFGQETPFPQLGGKQLHYKVPMQYWVLDLDDGFKQPVTGKYVHIEDIASTPMLKLWEGMIAIPWKGPPALNTKGFMSVMFNAATNPDLAVSRTTSFAVRNYFMISRKFLSLQSRFGFHFCTVEALVGERRLENYVSFQFKGGAADEDRRERRAHFVGWLLERYGFRTRIRLDSLFARLEGMDRNYMEDSLKILGYMLIHTRQLDMIMGDDQAVARYKHSIMQDLEQEMGIPRID